MKRFLFIGVTLGGLLIALDSFFHGSFTVTPYEFFKVNVIDNIGSFYGSHPIYWYFSSGLPAILGIGIVPFYLAIFDTMKYWKESVERQVIIKSIIFTIFAFSLLPHKEFRFLLQILPLCLYIITSYLSNWSRTKSEVVIWFTAIVILVANVIPAGYLEETRPARPARWLWLVMRADVPPSLSPPPRTAGVDPLPRALQKRTRIFARCPSGHRSGSASPGLSLLDGRSSAAGMEALRHRQPACLWALEHHAGRRAS